MTHLMPAAGPEVRHAYFPLDEIEVRNARDGSSDLTIAGHAAVFDRLSENLGGFRERIARGAFDKVLDSSPQVHLVHEHDLASTMASTRSKTLELRSDPAGLKVWAKVDAEDFDVKRLAPKIRRGDVNAMSFGFNVAVDGDRWTVETDHETNAEIAVRTITQIGALYDVSVVALPAYRATDVNLRGLLEAAIANGRLPVQGEPTNRDPHEPDEVRGVADPAATTPEHGASAGPETRAAQDEPADARPCLSRDEARDRLMRRIGAYRHEVTQ